MVGVKIVAVCGSPRKGNTEFMLDEVLKVASEAGAQTELILLGKKNIRFCDGCQCCEKTGLCRIEDDMKNINEKLIEADVVVIGSPTYFDNVSALLKNFIDRTNPLTVGNKLENKKAAIVVVGGASLGEGSIEKAAENIKTFCSIHKMKIIDTICASGSKPEDVSKDEKIKEQLKKLGEKLAK